LTEKMSGILLNLLSMSLAKTALLICIILLDRIILQHKNYFCHWNLLIPQKIRITHLR